MKRKKIVVTAVAVAFCGAFLSGCEDDTTTGSKAKPKSSATTATPSGEKKSDAQPTRYPSPDAAQTQKLITAFRAIDPGLVVNEDRAVRRAENTCMDVKQGKDDATVAKTAELRFEGGNVPDVSSEQAAQIVDVVKTTFCK